MQSLFFPQNFILSTVLLWFYYITERRGLGEKSDNDYHLRHISLKRKLLIYSAPPGLLPTTLHRQLQTREWDYIHSAFHRLTSVSGASSSTGQRLSLTLPNAKKKLMLLLCNPIKPIPSDLRLSWVIGWYLLRSVCTKINFRYERRCQLHDCHKILSKIFLQVTHINLSLKKTIYVSDNWSSPIYKFGPEQLNFCVRYLECATRERWTSECFCKVSPKWLCMPMAINMHQSRQFRQ